MNKTPTIEQMNKQLQSARLMITLLTAAFAFLMIAWSIDGGPKRLKGIVVAQKVETESVVVQKKQDGIIHKSVNIFSDGEWSGLTIGDPHSSNRLRLMLDKNNTPMINLKAE